MRPYVTPPLTLSAPVPPPPFAVTLRDQRCRRLIRASILCAASTQEERWRPTRTGCRLTCHARQQPQQPRNFLARCPSHRRHLAKSSTSDRRATSYSQGCLAGSSRHRPAGTARCRVQAERRCGPLLRRDADPWRTLHRGGAATTSSTSPCSTSSSFCVTSAGSITPFSCWTL